MSSIPIASPRLLALAVIVLSLHPVLRAQSLSIHSPTRDVQINVGDWVEIRWSGGAYWRPYFVDFSADDGNSWRTIASVISGSSFRWSVDTRATTTARFRVRQDVPATSPDVVIQYHTSRVSDAAFSPDDRTIASIGLDRTLRVWDPNTGELLWSRGTSFPIAFESSQWARPRIAFSPDGNSILVTTRNPWGPASELFNVATGRGGTFLIGVGNPARFIDNDHVLCPYGVYNLATGGFDVRFADSSQVASGLGYTDVHEVVSTTCQNSTFTFRDVRTGLVTRRIGSPTHGHAVAVVSPDRRHIASMSSQSMLQLRSSETTELLVESALPAAYPVSCYVSDLEYSRTGDRITHTTAVGDVHVVDAFTLRDESVISGHTGPVNSIDYSSDGNRIATAGDDRFVRITRVRAGEVVSVSDGLVINAARVRTTPPAFDTVIVPLDRSHRRPWVLASEASAMLTLTPLGFRGIGAAAYHIDGSVRQRHVVMPGTSLSFGVEFRPADDGRYDAELLVRAGEDTLAFPISAIAARRPIATRVTLIDFGTLVASTSRDTVLSSVVSNLDSLGHSITIASAGDAFKVVEGGGTYHLDPGASYPLQIRFAPGDRSGTFRDTLAIGFDGPGSPLVIALTGRAVGRPSGVALDDGRGSLLEVFPNPADAEVIVRSPLTSSATLRMIDPIGRCIRMMPMEPSSTLTLDVTGMAAGPYRLVLTSDKHSSSTSLIIRAR